MKLSTSTKIFAFIVLCATAQAIPAEDDKKAPTLPTLAPKPTPAPTTVPTVSTTTTTAKPTQKPTEPPTPKPTEPSTSKPPTTVPPTPKPTEPPTTKPMPTPTPSTPAPTPTTTAAPKSYDWEVVGDHDIVCILAKMNININLKYKSDPHKDIHWEVPKNATGTGTCGDVNQTLTLSWGSTDNISNLTMTFHMDNKTNEYYVSTFAAHVFENKESSDLILDHLSLYQTKNSSSYTCSYSSPVELKVENATLLVTLTEIRLEAFRNSNTTTFSNAISCPPDSPDLVPIVVGIALTLLIIVVLVTYLIGRKRNQASGYTSM